MSNNSNCQILYRLVDVKKKFDSNIIFENLNFQQNTGQNVAIVGKSGVGKTTILKIISGLDNVIEGQFEPPQNFSMVFQTPKLIPFLSVQDNVMISSKNTAQSDQTLESRALNLLEQVGLKGFEKRYPLSLSGGQMSRVALVRALMNFPKLLLLDEPFGSLDALTRIEMQQLLIFLRGANNFSTLLVTHDVEEAIELSDMIYILGAATSANQIIAKIAVPKNCSVEDKYVLKRAVLKELGVVNESN